MRITLTQEEWAPIAAAHAARADALTAGYRERAGRGQRHAIEDFLFDYYSMRPSHLRRWHPGVGVGLEGAPDHAGWRFYDTRDRSTSLDAEAFWEAKGSTVDYVEALLRATADRSAMRGCFGLHEWAMVYRAGEDRRHSLPLRLGQDGTDAVVDSHDLVCTHMDAFRFFTPEASPRNAVQLTRADQPRFEQPGCLHANMDLYKWAGKLMPAVASKLALDAFELALEVRYLDMQASPYDVSEFGLEPVRIETPEGKRDYATRQAEFSRRAAPLRERLIRACVDIRLAAGADAPAT
ncbi:3-methyladenine DNA glycosylase [Demequina sp. TTPB684]|nr:MULTISPECIES: 3-methyladenine DNA glycosylase [unclassified Demequina]MCB2412499.1 3-methyladenine DNA glycosylase [Demequina sp. TTPB684]UPU89693.1 3-methyladenine DNA glycosylase [Demequina sp. TMPB413]